MASFLLLICLSSRRNNCFLAKDEGVDLFCNSTTSCRFGDGVTWLGCCSHDVDPRKCSKFALFFCFVCLNFENVILFVLSLLWDALWILTCYRGVFDDGPTLDLPSDLFPSSQHHQHHRRWIKLAKRKSTTKQGKQRAPKSMPCSPKVFLRSHATQTTEIVLRTIVHPRHKHSTTLTLHHRS